MSATRKTMPLLEEEREVLRRLPRHVRGDGPGAWHRVAGVGSTAGCGAGQTLSMRSAAGGRLAAVSSGVSRCV